MKLDKNEIKNQHVHLFWGLAVGWVTGFIAAGALVGLGVECYQLVVKREGLKLGDRLLDLTSWAIGGVLPAFAAYVGELCRII